MTAIAGRLSQDAAVFAFMKQAMQKRIDEWGVCVGHMPKGKRNKITDVPGVTVGHCTIEEEPYRTGVTVILPGAENPFYAKPVAAGFVLNGYGKSLGLVQVEELGVLETPIALTNTLNVGLVHDALVQLSLERSHAEGRCLTSVNPIVLECNDGKLSDIAGRPVSLAHVRAAMADAREDFQEGSVGAGRGMICHGLKGGIGSASRVVELDGERYTVGLLVMANHGHLRDLMIGGAPVGLGIQERMKAESGPERGSVIAVVATDLPVDSRQLGRVLRRAPVGLARLGSHIGHGSGEIMLGFTTRNTMPFEEGPAVCARAVLREDLLDHAFRAVIECCEEATLNAMICAETTIGYKGDVLYALKDVWKK